MERGHHVCCSRSVKWHKVSPLLQSCSQRESLCECNSNGSLFKCSLWGLRVKGVVLPLQNLSWFRPRTGASSRTITTVSRGAQEMLRSAFSIASSKHREGRLEKDQLETQLKLWGQRGVGSTALRGYWLPLLWWYSCQGLVSRQRCL